MHHPAVDLALGAVWLPFVLIAHVLEGRGDPTTLAVFISAVFLLSFAHQPLTVALVYGDPAQFRTHPRLFTWTPLVLAVAVVVGVTVSFVLVAVVGALWNAEHTLMQRYGLVRIYGRKAGQDDGGIEKVMLCSWLVLAVVAVAAAPGTPALVGSVDVGANNRAALDVLVDLQPIAAWLVLPAALAALACVVVWARREHGRPDLNPAKWAYLASTAVLFGMVLVDPLAGIMGYVGAHAIEYFVIVHQSLGRRYGARADRGARNRRSAGAADSVSPAPAAAAGGLLGRVVRARAGRTGFLGAYVAVVFAVVTALAHLASPLAYLAVFFTLGGMHVFYDGFIWKLRRPVVAESLDLRTA
jgi:hypothetical protein